MIMRKTLPKKGRGWRDLEKRMGHMRKGDMDWRRGRHSFHVWYGGDGLFEIQKRAYTMFMQENGGGVGRTFMSLKIMEDEVIDFGAGLLHAPKAVGHITSGGSESIFVALKAARDWARVKRPGARRPEVVIPYSGHPTFNLAADYLGLTIKRVAVGADYRADAAAMEKAITRNTIALVGSAVCFPFGVVDPIRDLGRVAKRHSLWLHVDACVGGYTAPFVKKLGYPVPDFDFAVPGVCSMSADLHKYGFCAKGTSTVFYRNPSLAKYQPFDFKDWPQGRFECPNVASTRPGGSISAAWAVMNHLGEEGYLKLNKRLMRMRQRYINGIKAIDGLYIRGEPELLIVSYGSDAFDMGDVADEMQRRKWFVGSQVNPRGIMIGLSLPHEAVVGEYLDDLSRSVTKAKKAGKGKRRRAVRSTY